MLDLSFVYLFRCRSAVASNDFILFLTRLVRRRLLCSEDRSCGWKIWRQTEPDRKQKQELKEAKGLGRQTKAD